MRFVFFIGLAAYNMTGRMSLVLFAQFLLLVGLNFINPLHAAYQEGPVFRFADNVEGIPPLEFYDLLKVEESLWCAGEGVHVLEAGRWRDVLPSGRYTALTFDASGETLWCAGPEGLRVIDRESGLEEGLVEIDAGYLWELATQGRRIWFFGGDRYGWIDGESLEVEAVFEKAFHPRPFFLGMDAEKGVAHIGSNAGVWRIGETGHELVLPAAETGGMGIAWMVRSGEGYLLGSPDNLYRWSGRRGEAPIEVESNYGKFFRKGINNAVDLGTHAAVVDFPLGIVFIDKASGKVDTYVGEASGLDIGDVYRLKKGGDHSLLVMGKEGVAEVDLENPHRFFAGRETWDDQEILQAEGHGEEAFLFTERQWIRLREDGYEKSDLDGLAFWVDSEPSGTLVQGYLHGYHRFRGREWEKHLLEQPVEDLKWGRRTALATGQNGVYAVDSDLGMELIYPSSEKISLLGELGGSHYILEHNKAVLKLDRTGAGWIATRVGNAPGNGEFESTQTEEALYLSTGQALYRLSGERGLEELGMHPDWRVFALASDGTRAYAGFEDNAGQLFAVGMYEGGKAWMLELPGKERGGHPSFLLAAGRRLGLVGDKGLGWYLLTDLDRNAEPEISFNLFFEGRNVAEERLPNGDHVIDLRMEGGPGTIPVEVQYRINGGDWRRINEQDPVLQFAGHGGFEIDLQAIYPNGEESRISRIGFAIAPPWYLNPIYQLVMLALFLLSVWGIYMLRHAQLKRTNRWLEAEVKKQTRELEAATAARTNFLAGLSHDIRNPLNGVLMIAETLTRDPPRHGDDSRLRDLTDFGIIVDRMLGEILDFSAIDQTNTPMAYIPVSVADILGSSAKQNQYSIERALVRMEVEVPPELKEVVIKTDRNWMIKILTNLIVNALEYSDTDRIEVGAVCHRLTPSDVELEIYVKDWGKGIDEAEKPFVFDRFYRGESGIESGKHGTGLGLSICQEIAHAMGGHLLLTDNHPRGSCFVLKGRFERVAGAKELDREVVLKGLEGKRVLVVDDLRYNRRSIVEFLETIGCECDQSENGREALTRLSEGDYDLALLDWDLPGMMGPEVARRHRTAHPEDNVTLIALTAYTDGEKKRQSADVGMNGYISKPLTASRLAHCLANLEPLDEEPHSDPDAVDQEELDEEIYKHVTECLRYGEHGEWENLRRCAHRLTTLALMKENKAMQRICRDLQVSAEAKNPDEVRVGLAELRQWRRR